MKSRICRLMNRDVPRARGHCVQWVFGLARSFGATAAERSRAWNGLVSCARVIYFAAVVALPTLISCAEAAPIKFIGRSRQVVAPNESASVVHLEMEWESTKTAVIVCDMWDRHWCSGATARVAEMTPRMNNFLNKLRSMGMLIIHAPSGTMGFYEDYPQRKKAKDAKKSVIGQGLNSWRPLEKAREGPLPIDDSDGGCDDEPRCAQGSPWRSQIAGIEIAEQDAISDRGDEILGLMEERGMENVILLGVHANMCVLGRPFGIRAMVSHGKNVLLVRDLTDTMYNSRMRPFINHFGGTDLVIEHIEKHWCPTITSDQVLGGHPFRFKNDRRPTVVMVIGESEYHTWETLPAFASEVLLTTGLKIEYVTASTRADDYEFKGAGILGEADLVLVSARRRAMPHDMASLLKKHLESGKPFVGIRTASHAFALRRADRNMLAKAGLKDWPEFDHEVLGGHYSGHHPAGPLTFVRVVPDAADHPVLKNISSAPWSSPASLYKSSPLRSGAKVLLMGQIPGKQAEPIAWVNNAGPQQARVFYTSLGHPDDFKNPLFRRLLANGILWALGMETGGN